MDTNESHREQEVLTQSIMASNIYYTDEKRTTVMVFGVTLLNDSGSESNPEAGVSVIYD